MELPGAKGRPANGEFPSPGGFDRVTLRGNHRPAIDIPGAFRPGPDGVAGHPRAPSRRTDTTLLLADESPPPAGRGGRPSARRAGLAGRADESPWSSPNACLGTASDPPLATEYAPAMMGTPGRRGEARTVVEAAGSSAVAEPLAARFGSSPFARRRDRRNLPCTRHQRRGCEFSRPCTRPGSRAAGNRTSSGEGRSRQPQRSHTRPQPQRTCAPAVDASPQTECGEGDAGSSLAVWDRAARAARLLDQTFRPAYRTPPVKSSPGP